MTLARRVAVDVLHLARQRKAFASDLIDEQLATVNLSPQDRRLVTQLVMGTVRRRATLEALVQPFIHIPLHAVQSRVWDVLHLGALQLALLTHIPKHAAVHETVDLAPHIESPQARGFINGVLRRVSELVTDEFVDYPYSDTLPLDDGRYRRLNQPILPDPDEDQAAYLAAAFSWPRWLAERWYDAHGWDECVRLGFWFNMPPPLWLRVNKLRVDRETYRLRLAASLIENEPGEPAQSLRLLESASVRELPGYLEGEFAIQDVSSMVVAAALQPQPGMRILDLCAAPGGKTTHLAELMDNRGSILACDIDAKRLETVRALADRLGIGIITTQLLEPSGEPPQGLFDAALVDVPCSNMGVLGRRPEVRWRVQPNEFEHLIRLQTRLLFQAIDRVRPGGVIVYSTCSIERDENMGVVHAVRRGNPKLVVEAERVAIPGRPGDGGYWARIRKPMS
jgi:16S rRNA (cytosine967-C5)-methyltransferase